MIRVVVADVPGNTQVASISGTGMTGIRQAPYGDRPARIGSLDAKDHTAIARSRP